jgi:hypothetical protein
MGTCKKSYVQENEQVNEGLSGLPQIKKCLPPSFLGQAGFYDLSA